MQVFISITIYKIYKFTNSEEKACLIVFYSQYMYAVKQLKQADIRIYLNFV